MLILFKSLVLPILEYCSVFYCPLSVGSIQKLEAVQWSFIRQNYWNKRDGLLAVLKRTKTLLTRTPCERYRILYDWKILENLVPNINDGIKSYINPRQGRKCIIPTQTIKKLSKTRDSSFNIHALKLFNVLPRHIRNASSILLLSFKRAVDLCLKNIPDEHKLPNYTIYRRAPTTPLSI